jgi:hypothetical protein
MESDPPLVVTIDAWGGGFGLIPWQALQEQPQPKESVL